MAIFPGDLPVEVETVFRGAAVPLRFLRFRPPSPAMRGEAGGLPQIRLDRALDFLIGDALA